MDGFEKICCAQSAMINLFPEHKYPIIEAEFMWSCDLN